MSILSGASALTYDSVIAKYCGESNSSSIVMGAGVGGGVCIVVCLGCAMISNKNQIELNKNRLV